MKSKPTMRYSHAIERSETRTCVRLSLTITRHVRNFGLVYDPSHNHRAAPTETEPPPAEPPPAELTIGRQHVASATVEHDPGDVHASPPRPPRTLPPTVRLCWPSCGDADPAFVMTVATGLADLAQHARVELALAETRPPTGPCEFERPGDFGSIERRCYTHGAAWPCRTTKTPKETPDGQ